jgi:uncharacterized membrane protein
VKDSSHEYDEDSWDAPNGSAAALESNPFSIARFHRWSGTTTFRFTRETGESIMPNVNSVVAIYDTHEQAEQAVKELQEGGVDMKSLSIAAKDMHTDDQVVGYYNAGDRMKHWGKVGAFWGGFWGLLFGSALFAIPGIGPILVAGPLVAWIVAGLEGAVVVGGVGALGAGLVSIGIPKDSVIKYETALKTDKFLLIVRGTQDAVENAKDIIRGTSHSSYALHGEVVPSDPVLSR